MSESSLVPERQLVFSPGLASTIGLEEAILLQHLQELLQHGTPQLQRGFAWLSVERELLMRTLPFWQAIDLHRITRSLVDKGVLLVESPPLHTSERLIFALNESATRQQSTTPPIEVGFSYDRLYSLLICRRQPRLPQCLTEPDSLSLKAC